MKNKDKLKQEITNIIEKYPLQLVRTIDSTKIYKKEFTINNSTSCYNALKPYFSKMLNFLYKTPNVLQYNSTFMIYLYDTNYFGIKFDTINIKCQYTLIYYYRIDKDVKLSGLVTYSVDKKILETIIPKEGQVYVVVTDYCLGNISNKRIISTDNKLGIMIIEFNRFKLT